MDHMLLLLGQSDASGAAGAIAGLLVGGVMLLVWLGLVVLVIAGMWKAFAKAGQPGWACLVPIYNLIVLLQIAGKPIWWILLLLIPCANIIVIFMVMLAVAERFGQGVGFGIGLALLGFIFWPILGFGSAQYRGGPA